MGAMNVALLANNIGLLWVASELATLITVVMVGIYRTPAALEAAWKYFILGSVGICARVLRHDPDLSGGARTCSAKAWRRWPGASCWLAAGSFDPAAVTLAFVFLLVGYGTKVGLAPLHAWLPDAHAEGPDADLGGALGPAAQRGALCAASLQDDPGGAIRPP